MNLTALQRDEITHLHDIAEYEATDGDNENGSWRAEANAYRALLDGGDLCACQVKRLIAELEHHADKFAPARATKFRPADPGDRRLFASMNDLLRKVRNI